jgi:hypothetical protein
MPKRAVLVYGQFGQLADPVSLNQLAGRLRAIGFEVIIVQHMDSKAAYDYLMGFHGMRVLIGSSLGAMSAVVFAGYMMHQQIDFVGGFQPSDYDPSGHDVEIRENDPPDIITRAIEVPSNVANAVCFRNPVAALTGGLGHAAYVLDPSGNTKLVTYKREDAHPGDFGEAQDIMFNTVKGLANA